MFKHLFSLIACLFFIQTTFAQFTSFNNDGALVALDPNAILYIDGHLLNDSGGHISNKGTIYLTGDWTNNTPSFLDPNTGTVKLYGNSYNSIQNIKGTAVTTFNNLDCDQFTPSNNSTTKKLFVDTKVGGTSGVLSLNNCVFDLNGNNVTITNPLSTAVTRNLGYIISEIPPPAPYAKVDWTIGNSSGNYVFPFGLANGDYIPFTCSITSPGDNSGDLSVATYPTNVAAAPNNRPLPPAANNLNNYNGLEASDKCVDRFWQVDMNYLSTPTADYTFTYRDPEWDVSGGSTNFIHEDSLGAWPWVGTQWQNPPFGIANTSAKTVTAQGISYSAPWTLKEKEITDSRPLECRLDLPNAFSPNGDNHNDEFTLRGWAHCVSDFSIIIYNRWGEKVYESQNVNKSWDGTYLGKPQDPAVYVFYISAVNNNGEKVTKKGNVSLIR